MNSMDNPDCVRVHGKWYDRLNGYTLRLHLRQTLPTSVRLQGILLCGESFGTDEVIYWPSKYIALPQKGHAL